MKVILKALTKDVAPGKRVSKYTKVSNFTLVELLVDTPVDGEKHDVLDVLKKDSSAVTKVLFHMLHEQPFTVTLLGRGDLVKEGFAEFVNASYGKDFKTKIDLMFVLPYIGCLVCQIRASEVVAFAEAKRVTISTVCDGDSKFTFSESLF